MTPEGFLDVIDKAKQIWNGVRLYWESVLAEERKPVAPIKIEPQPHAEVNCPVCHAEKSMHEVYAHNLRCSACGWQPKLVLPPGIPRSQLETFEYPDAEHQKKFRRGFAEALWRIRGPHR